MTVLSIANQMNRTVVHSYHTIIIGACVLTFLVTSCIRLPGAPLCGGDIPDIGYPSQLMWTSDSSYLLSIEDDNAAIGMLYRISPGRQTVQNLPLVLNAEGAISEYTQTTIVGADLNSAEELIVSYVASEPPNEVELHNRIVIVSEQEIQMTIDRGHSGSWLDKNTIVYLHVIPRTIFNGQTHEFRVATFDDNQEQPLSLQSEPSIRLGNALSFVYDQTQGIIWYVTQTLEGDEPLVYYHPSTGNRIVIDASCTQPLDKGQLLANGQLVYAAYGNDGGSSGRDLYLVGPDSTLPHNLSNDLEPGDESHPSWSPDGRYIAYVMTQAAAQTTDELFPPRTQAIMLLDVANNHTEQLHRLPTNSTTRWPEWSPDGRWLAFIERSDASNRIIIIDMSTRESLVFSLNDELP